MSLFFLIIGTILAIVFIILLIRGKKYHHMLRSLQGNDFPLPSVYCVGMVLQQSRIGKMPSPIATYLRKYTKLVYTPKYSEYYTRVIWAQALSLGLLLATVCFLLAGIMTELAPILGAVAVVMLVFPGWIFIKNVKDQVNERKEQCEEAFPNAISKLALIVNSGVILHDAWGLVADGNSGVFYDLMQESRESMKNGKSDIDAIFEFGYRTDSEEIKKFASALIQSIERGGGELPAFLSNQSKELWAHHRQSMLQKGEKAAAALLAPIAVMLIGIMAIVLVAALQSLL